MEILASIAGIIGVPTAGYAIKRQLELNQQTRDNTKDIAFQNETLTHIRSRVDDLYDHLIEEGKRDRS